MMIAKNSISTLYLCEKYVGRGSWSRGEQVSCARTFTHTYTQPVPHLHTTSSTFTHTYTQPVTHLLTSSHSFKHTLTPKQPPFTIHTYTHKHSRIYTHIYTKPASEFTQASTRTVPHLHTPLHPTGIYTLYTITFELRTLTNIHRYNCTNNVGVQPL